MPKKTLNSKSKPTLASLGQVLFTVLTTSLAFSYILSFLLGSYFQISLTESLIFNVNDGWCDPAKQGIGAHCFGDFHSWMQSSLSNPWKESITGYPPLSVIFFKLMQGLYVLSNSSHLALFVYLFTLSICISFPIIHLFATKRIESLRACLIMGLVLFTLAPTLMVIDRGNNIGFAVPLVYLCFMYALNNQDKAFLVSVTILCLWKPQLGVLSLYFIYRGKNKWFLSWLIVVILGYLASFSFFGLGNVFNNAKHFFNNLVGYQGYTAIPGYFPSNWSFANFLSVLLDFPRLLSSFPSLDLESKTNLLRLPLTYVSITFLIFSLVIIKLKANRLDKIEVLTLLCLLSILTPSVTFSYYLSILIPLVVLICYGILAESQTSKSNFLSEQEAIKNFILVILRTKSQRIIFTGVISTCFVSWPITWKLLGAATTSPARNIGVVWTIGLMMIHVWYFSILFRKTRKRTRELQ